MQQELIEMLEEIIPYVEVWKKDDQDVIDKAEALVAKAKNNAPAQGEQINKALGKLRAAQWGHPNEVERLIDEAIDALVATPAPVPALLEFAEEVRRTGDTRLASMAIALLNNLS